MEFQVLQVLDWQKVVDEILPKLEHNILLLKGNLGAGKTTFTQFLLKSLGTKDEVSSPTYAIVNEYETPKGMVFHFDLYRLKSVEEVFDIGMDEYLERGFLNIIEWPEIFEDDLNGLQYHEMKIEHDGDSRKATFR